MHVYVGYAHGVGADRGAVASFGPSAATDKDAASHLCTKLIRGCDSPFTLAACMIVAPFFEDGQSTVLPHSSALPATRELCAVTYQASCAPEEVITIKIG